MNLMHQYTRTRAGLIAALFMAVILGNDLPGQNLLSDPGFESGTPVPGAVGGWATVVDASFSRTFAHSGQWSMDCYYSASGFHGVSVQSLTAVPGAQYSLTGWAYTPATLGSIAYANLILFFADSNGALLGSYYGSSPLPSTSVGAWVSLSVSQIAPINAATVWAETSLFNPSAGDAVYFDDLSLTIVPEPAVATLIVLPMALCLLRCPRCR